MDPASIKRSLGKRLLYSMGKDPSMATERDWLTGTAYMVRDRLIQRRMETKPQNHLKDAKSVYYLSLEFLIGRSLTNGLLNMGLKDVSHQVLYEMGQDLEKLCEIEVEAALGNGGLGRLASCILDSMATLHLPGYGYGIRYEYGMFQQKIEEGYQVEHPENWLRLGNPWEFPRPEMLYPVRFYGRVEKDHVENGDPVYRWVGGDEVMAMAYDIPIPGYGTNTNSVNILRLWSAKATRDFDLRYFNKGNYIEAVKDKVASEIISKVLYPSDSTVSGRELRLKQQYFFVCASLQDILRRFIQDHGSLELLPDKVAIQLNDTHPAIAIPELMRILLDIHHLDWDRAWSITFRTFAYTNHTLLPEALETWPVSLFEAMLPRHLQIIYEINKRFLKELTQRYPGDMDLVKRLSIIQEEGERRIRMAHLAVVGSHKVNGVARLHTQLMRETIFAGFNRFYPDRFLSITNGITPRRWLNQANPRLASLISSRIGQKWVSDLDHLTELIPLAEDEDFRNKFYEVKRANKERLAGLIKKHLGIEVNVSSLFDVQVKRIHEYKRQLLNVLHVITLYNRLRSNPGAQRIPRTVIFAGKAAPDYVQAKIIIKLIHDVADRVNNDPMIGDRLKVVFIPNYNVSTAEDIIPACELSEQISTAGTEASGTGNMKMALNGGLIIGTLDGANIEIQEQVGEENIFIFGLNAEKVAKLRQEGYDPNDYYSANSELRQVLDMIASGFFSPDSPGRFRPIIDSLTGGGDRYFLLADYDSFVACQERVEALYKNRPEWTRRAILNVANMGKFSSDRVVREYAEKIWNVRPVLPSLQKR
ncbi:MAG: glycogen/starch/alpha-glucan phosphorylase [Nitrospirae bacterium]|nr:glycogen/starch/alpha-glucan phosphorylase [Nitrospirota bacterium]